MSSSRSTESSGNQDVEKGDEVSPTMSVFRVEVTNVKHEGPRVGWC